MANTYRISIEYTTIENRDPNKWNWYELFDIDTFTETLDMSVDKIETNEDHVQHIIANREDN